MWITVIALLVVLIVGVIAYNAQTNGRKKQLAEDISRKREIAELKYGKLEDTGTVINLNAMPKAGVEVPPVVPPPVTPPPPSNTPPPREERESTVVILARRKAQDNSQQNLQPTSNSLYFSFDMSRTWTDSAISEVQLSRSCFAAIDNFIRTQNNKNFEEQDNAIPEIGGFLLGSYQQIGGSYKVQLEKFVESTPDNNDVYKIEFGTNAWHAFDDLKLQYPNLSVIGWFHTHPGHSLFLSQPDLKIHEGFFREPWQLAMEMDTKTEDLHTGFFTRSASGKVNNTTQLIKGASWFSWLDADKWSRKL